MLLPVLLSGERIVIQLCAVETVHAQPMGVASATEFVTASRAWFRRLVERANTQGNPFWTTVTNWPAISTTPVRARLVGLAATTAVTEPLVVWLAGDVKVIHAFVFVLVQAQPFSVVTEKVFVNAAEVFVTLDGATANRHGAASCVMVKVLSAI